MRVSVALCTYNGSSYLRNQLDSIFSQSYPIDEVVICDDGSNDSTIDIIKDYQKHNKVISLYQNKENVGVCTNFQKAVDMCSGDVIFLSDQDDIWLPEKTCTVLDWFDRNKDKEVVFSNAKLIDKDSNVIYPSWSLFDAVGFTSENRCLFDHGLGLELFMAWNRATGATMAMRGKRSFIQDCNRSVLHDEAIAVRSLMNNKLGYITTPLTYYRIHESQHTGLLLSAANFNNKSQCSIVDMTEYLEDAKRWQFYHDIEEIERIKFHFERLKLAESGSLLSVCVNINRYKQLFNTDYFLFFGHDLKRSLRNLPKRYKKTAKRFLVK